MTDYINNTESRHNQKLDELLTENKDLSSRVINIGLQIKDQRSENTELKDKIRDYDLASARQSDISKSMIVQQGTLDQLKDKAHQLLKKLALVYKEASKVDKAYEGTLDLLKGWSKSTSSDKKTHIENLITTLDGMNDIADIKIYNDKIHRHKQEEIDITNACTSQFRYLIEELESDITSISKELVNKSKKLSMLKVEMDKVEPGRQIPATLVVQPNLPNY